MLFQLYKPFQHWSEQGTIWIYSDPHFSDPEMVHLRKNYIGDEEQIKRINSKVGKKDTIIFLGDIGNVELIKKVKGYKVLIKGNHDSGSSNYQRVHKEYWDETARVNFKFLDSIGKDCIYKVNDERTHVIYDNHLFDEVYDGALIIAEKLILSHEPIDLPWAFNIHGHDHSNWFNGKNHLNVCAEWVDYTPVNLTQFIKKGGMSRVETIHRITIDKAVGRKKTK